MRPDGRIFYQRAIMFGDGHGGAATQVHAISEGDVDTGITLTWSRKSRAEAGVRTFTFGGETFDKFEDALAAYDASKPAA